MDLDFAKNGFGSLLNMYRPNFNKFCFSANFGVYLIFGANGHRISTESYKLIRLQGSWLGFPTRNQPDSGEMYVLVVSFSLFAGHPHVCEISLFVDHHITVHFFW